MIPNIINPINASSDYYNCLSLIPQKIGFKMAFLNLVTLLPKIDEIRYWDIRF